MNEDRADPNFALQGAVDEFVWDLFWTDDLGLWELTWMGSGRVDRSAADLVPWAREVARSLVDQGVIRLSATTWPGMVPERPLDQADEELLANEKAPWFDPENASLLVVVESVGEPTIPRDQPPWTFDTDGRNGGIVRVPIRKRS